MPPPSAVTGTPALILRAEGAALACLAVAGYAMTGAGWGLFAAAILAPDLAMLAYLGGPRLGAAAYNAAHSTLGPVSLGALAWGTGWAEGLAAALVWAAHVGLDRALGYGLKHSAGFRSTHLSSGALRPARTDPRP